MNEIDLSDVKLLKYGDYIREYVHRDFTPKFGWNTNLLKKYADGQWHVFETDGKKVWVDGEVEQKKT